MSLVFSTNKDKLMGIVDFVILLFWFKSTLILQVQFSYIININNNFICRIMGREAKALVFADSSTYSGSDENPLFDEDDELALMAR